MRRLEPLLVAAGVVGVFGLWEVLVALGVLALTMGAGIKAVGGYTANQSYLRDRTLAVWVARNVLVEQQVQNAWPGVGEFKGTAEMGKQEWRWLVRDSSCCRVLSSSTIGSLIA